MRRASSAALVAALLALAACGSESPEDAVRALAALLPPGRTPSAIDYAAGQLRLRGLGLGMADVTQIATAMAARGYSAHVRRRTDELELKRTIPGWRARRWVVEACHSWLNRNRALLTRWSKKPENHLALLQLACGLIAFKKAHAARLAHALPG